MHRMELQCRTTLSRTSAKTSWPQNGEADDEGIGRELGEAEEEALLMSKDSQSVMPESIGSTAATRTVTTAAISAALAAPLGLDMEKREENESYEDDFHASPDEAAITAPPSAIGDATIILQAIDDCSLVPIDENSSIEKSSADQLLIASAAAREADSEVSSAAASASSSSIDSVSSEDQSQPPPPFSWLIADAAEAELSASFEQRWSQAVDAVQRELDSVSEYSPTECSRVAVRLADEILRLLVSGDRFKVVTMVTLMDAGYPAESRFHQVCRSADVIRDLCRVAAYRGRTVSALVCCHFFRLD